MATIRFSASLAGGAGAACETLTVATERSYTQTECYLDDRNRDDCILSKLLLFAAIDIELALKGSAERSPLFSQQLVAKLLEVGLQYPGESLRTD